MSNQHPQSPLSPFTRLADPSTYVACNWDLVADAEARLYWCAFFKRHIRTITKLGIEAATARGGDLGEVTHRSEALLSEFDAFFDRVIADPQGMGEVTILTLDIWRDGLLRKHGFVDAFIDLKNRENDKMLPLLPAVCAQVDALSGLDAVRAIVEGVFAGNIFDMGAEATAKAFAHGSPDFFATRAGLSPRPWLIDDFDALATRLLDGPVHRKAIFFIDNAGSDFLLGALPMARWLAQRGTRVVLAANERPTLNDMTIHDVNAWWPRIIATEPSLATLPIDRVSTGTGEPLIDLQGVSPELNAAAADADLVILEGMGRGVESNLDATFNCDAVNLAMIKDLSIANRHAGKVYDCVCRFR
jgi:type II pantothenate kinase